MRTVNSGSLLSVSGSKVWKGGEKTNGFLMRNADGRVSAITQSGTLDLAENTAGITAVPFGNGLFRRLDGGTKAVVNELKSGVALADVIQFAGVVKYEQGWAESQPVQNWGIPGYSKFTAITRGIVGYKFSQKAAASDADYLAFIKGDKTKVTAIDAFDDWIAALYAATALGSTLYLLVSLTTGFPRVIAGGPDRHSVSIPAGFILIGQAVVFEPENDMIGFELNGDIAYGSSEVTKYAITYDANGATGGSVPVDATTYAPGEPITAAANSGSLVKTGAVFAGWNTEADGSGASYDAADVFAMGHAAVKLYAVWNPTYAVTYNGNGSTGGTVPTDSGAYEPGDAVTVLDNTGTLVLAGKTFSGWNTAANGSGITYTAAQTFAMGHAAVTLYAVWA